MSKSILEQEAKIEKAMMSCKILMVIKYFL